MLGVGWWGGGGLESFVGVKHLALVDVYIPFPSKAITTRHERGLVGITSSSVEAKLSAVSGTYASLHSVNVPCCRHCRQ